MTAPVDPAGAGDSLPAAGSPRVARDARLVEIMARVADADRQAFAQLYRATSAALFGQVLRINGDRGQAEEVLQEVYVTVWKQAASYDPRQAQPLTWLTTIARHRAIDSMRRKASQPLTVSRFSGPDDADGGGGEGANDLLAHLPSDAPGPLDLLDDSSRAHSLQRCMAALSGEQRSSLALAYYQGLSHAEVAEHMHQPLGTVKSWVRRGLQSLRACLDRAGERLGSIGRIA